MILTALSHALITTLCGLVGWYFGELGIGLTVGLGFYFGREVAQHERKERGTHPLRGLKVWKWNMDSVLDMLFPIIAAVGLIIIERML